MYCTVLRRDVGGFATIRIHNKKCESQPTGN
jgi:hypothetical protein